MWGTTARQRLRLLPLYAAIALADLATPGRRKRRANHLSTWQPGVSVVIPDRDAPDLLAAALESVYAAQAPLREPVQVVVVANGAPADRYRATARRYPDVDWIHLPQACGFSKAIAVGLAAVRHEWTLLLNNDMTLDEQALVAMAEQRRTDIFAIAAQIFQRSADGRREETGFTDWYQDTAGVHAFHAPVDDAGAVREILCASGGAALFRTVPLRVFAREARVYDPFYWEDVEWGVRAQRDGLRVIYCPAAHAHHRHRATVARFHAAAEIDRIVARNRVLFDVRNAATRNGAAWLMQRVCDLDYRSQRELSGWSVASGVLRTRWRGNRAALPSSPPALSAPDRTSVGVTPSYSFKFRERGARPCLLFVTPFCVYPARHGGARRVQGLLRELRRDYDVVLVSDEASLYDARSFAHFDGLHGVTLVQRREGDTIDNDDLAHRMETHAHVALSAAVVDAIRHYRPDIIQVEHVELALLSRLRTAGERWVLGIHDAYRQDDFGDPNGAARLDAHLRETYDAVTVCSGEDQALVTHPDTRCVPNASSVELGFCPPSEGARLLFIGPFRYAPNLEGIRGFIVQVWPVIRAAVPQATLTVLGGNEGPRVAAMDPVFEQPGIEVLAHRDDVGELLASAALTVNPLSGIRGSPVKLIESLVAGRACVSTEEGARGFRDPGIAARVTVPSLTAMAQPIIELLQDDARRRAIETPDASKLRHYTWMRSAQLQCNLYRELLDRHG